MKYNGLKINDRVLTKDSFDRSYIGIITKFETVEVYKRKIKLVHIKDNQGIVISRNIKHVKLIIDKRPDTD